jgi:hypothetical protein
MFFSHYRFFLLIFDTIRFFSIFLFIHQPTSPPPNSGACNSLGVTSTGGNSSSSSSTPVVPKSLIFRAVTKTRDSNEATALL